MKNILFLAILAFLSAFMPYAKFPGKKMAGKWNWVKSTIQLKYNDGSTQNVTVDGKPGEYVEYKYLKTVLQKAEGVKMSGFGEASSEGVWILNENDNLLEITQEIGEGQKIYAFRYVSTLTDHKMVLTADDALVLRQYTANNLLNLGKKKLVGGSVVEEYSK